MISFLRGRVHSVSGDVVVIDLGSVGMAAHCTAAVISMARVGMPIDIPATLVVREESLTLFGFADGDERALFDLLQTVSGFGPKVSLAMLSTLGSDRVRSAIAREDLAALTTVPGVGRKGAERLVIELRDRITAFGGSTTPTPTRSEAGWQAQVRAALVGLGWTPRDADAAVDRVEGDADDDVARARAEGSVSSLLRTALRSLDRA
jgi:holliday junction DNA helicase RuvA